MLYQLRCLLSCLMILFIAHIQGMEFSMNTTVDRLYCGHLQCYWNKNSSDNIFSINSLAIYDVTQSPMPVILTSLSIFNPVLYVNPTKVNALNATGIIGKLHAELTVSLKDVAYCLNGSFLCELNFVNLTADPDSIKRNISAENSRNCYESAKDNIKIHQELADLRLENENLKTELARLQEIVNSTNGTVQSKCIKGEAHVNRREKFLLWDKVPALCDTETDGGGWIVIQRRTKGDVDFYRAWDDYKKGFGTPDTDFWIGNDNIHNLTSQGYTELRFDVEHQGNQNFAHYFGFKVANESLLYQLSVTYWSYTGTANDSFGGHHNGRRFATYDKENDLHQNCASKCHGAWWYNNCYNSNLNGLWGATNITGIFWYGISRDVPLSFTEMKVRRVQ